MKKLSFTLGVLLLSSNAFALSVSKFYFKQTDANTVKFVIKGEDLNKAKEEIYINADNKKETGYSDDNVRGAEYLIKDENLYKYENGEWELLSQSVSEKLLNDNEKKEITIDIRDLNLYPFIRSYLYVPSKDLIKSARKNIVNYEYDRYVKEFYDYWKKNYLIKNDDGTYRVAFDKNDKSRTVSEGQGYGMIIVANMYNYDPKAREYFDGLYKFVQKHPSKFSDHLMAWQYPESDEGEDSAFDGDADIAYALILANKIWGSNGEINYKEEAKKVLKDIWDKTIGPDSKLPMLGDWVDPDGKKYNQYTFRSSDCMLSHFKVFASFTGNKEWLDVENACKNALFRVQNDETGLIPDFIVKQNDKFVPADENFLEGVHDGDYHYNACRVPMRLGADALIYDDDFSDDFTYKMSDWLTSTISAPNDIKSGYTLDGTAYNDYFSTAFATPFAVGLRKRFEIASNDIFDFVKDKKENYYEDSLNLISMSILSGRYYYLSGNTSIYAPNVKLDLKKPGDSDETLPPYSLDKFKPILDHSKLQYPDSDHAVRQPGEFEGFKTDYFYAQNDSLFFVVKQTEDQTIERLELREKYPDKKYKGDWKVSTKEEKLLRARVRFQDPGELKEFTFLQIHADGNVEDSLSKPLVRIAWIASKTKDGKEYKGYIWAIVKKDEKGVDNVSTPLMPRSDMVMKFEISVKDSILKIRYNDKTWSRDVSYWEKNYNYFKAGIYISGSANKKLDPLKRNAKIEFLDLSF
ncbi:MAG: hypothetical protein GXO01_05520 [Epsilonproteobacteria bacterium]|nr:hypothetical protein [Campylobacterota bacterium]